MRDRGFSLLHAPELLIVALILTLFLVPQTTAQPSPTKGPRVDSLFIRISPYSIDEVDIMDADIGPIPIGWVPKPYERIDMYDFEINNNRTIKAYPNWASPMWDAYFRRAISHLADKEAYVTEILNGLGIVLDTPIMPWLTEWYNPNAPKYPYDPGTATSLLDAAGYTMGITEFRVYPPWHEKAGQSLDPLIFYTRIDDPERLAASQRFRDELIGIGIPIDFRTGRRELINQEVMVERNYHIYSGAWMLLKDPDYLYGLYHTNPVSKDLISDPELDYWLENLKWARDRTSAKTAAWEAQRRLMEIAGTIPLWASMGVKTHREGWAGTVNQRGFGIDSFWTFINAWPTTGERPWTIRYGLSNDIEYLNPVFSAWISDFLVFDKVYDTMMKENPYDPTLDLPWMASSWNVDTWIDPIGLGEKTRLTFRLCDNIYWHTSMPPPVQVTAADVKFTIEYIKNYTDSWNYYKVADVHHIETPDPYTVIVYENVLSFWTLHLIGELPILPKHVWEGIADPHGFMPDPTLTGSGPFKFNSYTPGYSILLTANRNYFMPFHPKGDVNFDRIVDIFDIIMVASAWGSQPGDPTWDQRADLNADNVIDIYDLITVAVEFGKEWLPDP